MKQVKTDKVLFVLSMAGFTALALSFLLMAPYPGTMGMRVFPLAAGSMFWGGLLIGSVGQIVLSVRRRKWLRVTQRRERHRRIGLLSFGRNSHGAFADVALAISVAGLAVSIWLTRSTGIVCYFFLCFTAFFFETHCIFNGKNYNYVMTICKESKINRR